MAYSEKVAIHVAHHAPLPYELTGEAFRPFLLGGEGQIDPSYAEMRCHRQVWQEGVPDWVGFHHYRRAFLYPIIGTSWRDRALRDPTAQIIQTHPNEFAAYIAALDRIPATDWAHWLSSYDVIVPRPLLLGGSMAAQYIAAHRRQDWEMFAALLREERLDDGRLPYLTAFNMFLMRDWLFNAYMSVWQKVMCQLQERVIPPKGEQHRVFGFLSERLFTSWLFGMQQQSPRLRVLLLPVLVFEGMS